MENQLPSPTPENELPIYTPPLELDSPAPTKTTNLLFPIALVTIALAAIVGLAGYTIGKQSVKPLQVVTNTESYITPIVPAPTTIPESPTPTMTPIMPDLTGDWDLYTGKEYTFKHPQNMQWDTNGAETGVENIRYRFMGQKQIATGRTQTELFDGYMFIVSKRGLASEKSPAEWAVTVREQSMKECEGVTGASFTLPEKVTIADSTGMQFSSTNCRADYTVTYLNHNGTVYEIHQMYTGDEVDLPQYKEITNQMFRSLKFL